MSQDSESRGSLAQVLVARMERGADAAEIAAVVANVMADIEAKLWPIIGKGGVVAMYRRTLHEASEPHPWLRDSSSNSTGLDLDLLRVALASRATHDAVTAGAFLLQSFIDLLASLVGRSLGDRLLGDVCLLQQDLSAKRLT